MLAGKLERQPAGEQPEEQDAERVDVGGGGDLGAGDLLGRRVGGGHRPHRGAGLLDREGHRRRIEQLGDAEVEQLGLAFAVDQDVRRLEVAVHHQVLVGVGDRRADVDEELQPFLERQLVLLAVGVERQAVDVLEHEVGAAVGGGAAFEKPGDVGMVEAGEDLPLGEEALVDDRQVLAGADDLDRHLALEFLVAPLGQVDHPHAAAAQHLEQPVGADPLGVERGVAAAALALRGRQLDEAVELPQHAVDLAPQLRILAGDRLEVGAAQRLLEVERHLDQADHPPPALRADRGPA